MFYIRPLTPSLSPAYRGEGEDVADKNLIRPLPSRPCVTCLQKLADVLVKYSVGVKKGQLVRISGAPVAQPLIFEIYRKVIEAGGMPFVRINAEELQEIFLKERQRPATEVPQSDQSL